MQGSFLHPMFQPVFKKRQSFYQVGKDTIASLFQGNNTGLFSSFSIYNSNKAIMNSRNCRINARIASHSDLLIIYMHLPSNELFECHILMTKEWNFQTTFENPVLLIIPLYTFSLQHRNVRTLRHY